MYMEPIGPGSKRNSPQPSYSVFGPLESRFGFGIENVELLA